MTWWFVVFAVAFFLAGLTFGFAWGYDRGATDQANDDRFG